MRHSFLVSLAIILTTTTAPVRADDFPPGWLPIKRLDDKLSWDEFRKSTDALNLYMPNGDASVRGVFVCYVFHSQDPRELARLWNFALVTVPPAFEYDLGHNDKRNGRFKLGHPVGNMGLLLKYLDVAARETKHPELATVPIVGWLGQNGSTLCNDLYQRAPERVLAWTDSFPNTLAKYPEVTKNVPFALAWEFTPNDQKERAGLKESKGPGVKDQPTPAPDLKSRANTYSFPHGIYSKFNFFIAFLHRCILARMPDQMPPPGQPVKLKPLTAKMGWVGDFNEVSEWNPIAPVDQAKGMVAPVWFPDEYMAWTWRAYHTAKPDIKLTAPAAEYRKGSDRKDCGIGFGPSFKAGEPLKFVAETTGNYTKIEFHDGDRIIGTATAAPWQIEGVRLEPGLRALFAVGVLPDGTRRSSRASFVGVQ